MKQNAIRQLVANGMPHICRRIARSIQSVVSISTAMWRSLPISKRPPPEECGQAPSPRSALARGSKVPTSFRCTESSTPPSAESLSSESSLPAAAQSAASIHCGTATLRSGSEASGAGRQGMVPASIAVHEPQPKPIPSSSRGEARTSWRGEPRGATTAHRRIAVRPRPSPTRAKREEGPACVDS
eukprot:scaffold281096_cov32-Tisochrysis_lutea.AAC.1